jgi:uncharacterized protein YggE
MKNKALILITAICLVVVAAGGCALPASAQNGSATPTVAISEAAEPAVTPDAAAASDKIVVQLDNAQDKNSVSVSATGTVKVTPDVAYTTVGVVTQKKKMKDAQSANRDMMNAVVEALKAAGLTDDEIRTTNYSVYPVYDYSGDTSVITAFEVNNTVELTIRDIDKVGEVLDAAASAGANTSYSVSFDLLDKSPEYNKALSAAMEAARGKADTLAAAGGFTIQGVMTVSEDYNSTPVYYEYAAAEDNSGKAPTYISSGDMDITASVSVVYEIK